MLGLAEPFASATVTAGIERRRRTVTFTLTEPGTLYRNAYERAWLEVSESDTWSGEATWVSATRRPPGATWAREPFTGKAREALRALLLPAVNRYGFGCLWAETFTARSAYRGCSEMAAEADRMARWWRDRDDLQHLVADGAVVYVPVGMDAYRRRQEHTVMTVEVDRRVSFEPVVAEVLAGGERVGWLTAKGAVVPDDGDLRRT